MLERNRIMNAASLVLCLGLLACGNASAMARRSVSLGGVSGGSTSTVNPAPAPAEAGRSEDYLKGYEYGNRNGTLISQRLADATLGREGCSALGKYQHGLVEVTKKIRAPRGPGLGKEISKGFFRGYLDAVRTSIEDARRGCSAVVFDEGLFAGELYGTLVCQTAESDVDALSELEVVPLYEGWSGGGEEVHAQCVTQARTTLAQCETALDQLQEATEVLIRLGCSD